jgi:hypothetical protein
VARRELCVPTGVETCPNSLKARNNLAFMMMNNPATVRAWMIRARARARVCVCCGWVGCLFDVYWVAAAADLFQCHFALGGFVPLQEDLSIKHLLKAVEIWDGMSSAFLNLGIIYMKREELETSAYYFWR